MERYKVWFLRERPKLSRHRFDDTIWELWGIYHTLKEAQHALNSVKECFPDETEFSLEKA